MFTLRFTVSLYVIFHGKITTLCSSLAGLDFDAVLLKPKEMAEGSKLPLIVMPHGLFFSAVCILQHKNDALYTLTWSSLCVCQAALIQCWWRSGFCPQQFCVRWASASCSVRSACSSYATHIRFMVWLSMKSSCFSIVSYFTIFGSMSQNSSQGDHNSSLCELNYGSFIIALAQITWVLFSDTTNTVFSSRFYRKCFLCCWETFVTLCLSKPIRL